MVNKIVDKLHERLRDHARDDVCVALQALGIQAQMSERGRWIEEITHDPITLGVIDISASPIQWVSIGKEFDDGATWAGGGFVTYTSHYGVPDPKIKPGFPKVRLESRRVRSFGLFGRAVGLQWKGKDFGLGLANRLNGDLTIAAAMITSRSHLDIRAHPKHGCWILTNIRNGEPLIPSIEQWACYQAIARHLLAMYNPTHP